MDESTDEPSDWNLGSELGALLSSSNVAAHRIESHISENMRYSQTKEEGDGLDPEIQPMLWSSGCISETSPGSDEAGAWSPPLAEVWTDWSEEVSRAAPSHVAPVAVGVQELSQKQFAKHALDSGHVPTQVAKPCEELTDLDPCLKHSWSPDAVTRGETEVRLCQEAVVEDARCDVDLEREDHVEARVQEKGNAATSLERKATEQEDGSLTPRRVNPLGAGRSNSGVKESFMPDDARDVEEAVSLQPDRRVMCTERPPSYARRLLRHLDSAEPSSDLQQWEPRHKGDDVLPTFMGLNLQQHSAMFREIAFHFSRRLEDVSQLQVQIPDMQSTKPEMERDNFMFVLPEAQTSETEGCPGTPSQLGESSSRAQNLVQFPMRNACFQWPRVLHMTTFYLGDGARRACLVEQARRAMEFVDSEWRVRCTHVVYALDGLLVVVLELLDDGLLMEASTIPHVTLLTRRPFAPRHAHEALTRVRDAGLLVNPGGADIVKLSSAEVAGSIVDLHVCGILGDLDRFSASLTAHLECFWRHRRF